LKAFLGSFPPRTSGAYLNASLWSVAAIAANKTLTATPLAISWSLAARRTTPFAVARRRDPWRSAPLGSLDVNISKWEFNRPSRAMPAAANFGDGCVAEQLRKFNG
jgi:hypothetical protein